MFENVWWYFDKRKDEKTFRMFGEIVSLLSQNGIKFGVATLKWGYRLHIKNIPDMLFSKAKELYDQTFSL